MQTRQNISSQVIGTGHQIAQDSVLREGNKVSAAIASIDLERDCQTIAPAVVAEWPP